ncbi:uncharacterized protein [Coffea arabica]|uniref:Uncharacterized protein isoform X1 n=1 Tax=Coffea arabica TaxID=13443 RepID=A0A6P6TJZ3_COFAR
MTIAMGPPPPRNPISTTSQSQARNPEEPSASSAAASSSSASQSTADTSSMGPPPPKIHNAPEPAPAAERSADTPQPKPSEADNSVSETVDSKEGASSSSTKDTSQTGRQQEKGFSNSTDIAVPYKVPEWNGPPCHHYSLEVLKDGSIIDQFDVYKKGAYMFGRVELCDFVLEHPTISRFHAVIQFKSNGEAYIYDLGSTHGTFINKNEVKKKAYVELHVGDVIRFGHSSRLYIFQGPTDLMPPEADLKTIRTAKIRQEMQDMEASLLRAKLEASLADGIAWGMQEDAIEEAEDEIDEITWQTYKGQLTEKQEKTREKVMKRLEKIAHMKKEIDAIRAKDIAQGGLTQGQQTQIARNEQRISQIMEELENLEETLNESIRESLGARAGKTTRGKRQGATEDNEEDYLSDDDDFYDRTQKPSKKKSGENQSIETADSLLEKKEAILKEMEDTRNLLLNEDKSVPKREVAEEGDALDAYMSSVSSQLAFDKKDKLEKGLASLQSELDRVSYLLKVADPTGEAARRRESKAQEPRHNVVVAASDAVELSPSEKRQSHRQEHSVCGSDKLEKVQNRSSSKESKIDATADSSNRLEASENVADATDDEAAVYTVAKAQWLGAVDCQKEQETRQESQVDVEEHDQFVDYKDRKAILENTDGAKSRETSGIENAAPGLIVRKRKHVEKSDLTDVKDSEPYKEAEIKAEDAVALLLKHSRGIHTSDEMEQDSENVPQSKQARKDKKKPKRLLGPERPSFLNNEPDYESWVPPEGQSGDGRTSLNDRYGY